MIDIAKFSVEERIAILCAATELPVSVRAATRSLFFFSLSPSFFDAKKMTARLAAAIRYVYLYSTMTTARRIKVKNTTTVRTYARITRPLVRSGQSL